MHAYLTNSHPVGSTDTSTLVIDPSHRKNENSNGSGSYFAIIFLLKKQDIPKSNILSFRYICFELRFHNHYLFKM